MTAPAAQVYRMSAHREPDVRMLATMVLVAVLAGAARLCPAQDPTDMAPPIDSGDRYEFEDPIPLEVLVQSSPPEPPSTNGTRGLNPGAIRAWFERLPARHRLWMVSALGGGAALLFLRQLGKRSRRRPAYQVQPPPLPVPASESKPARFSCSGALLLLGIAVGCGYGAYSVLRDASRAWTIWPAEDALKLVGLLSAACLGTLAILIVKVASRGKGRARRR